MMNRREALSRVALIMGGTVLGAEAFYRVVLLAQLD